MRIQPAALRTQPAALRTQALDGFMLPDAYGNTGVPWLTTEIHLTRKALPPSTATATTPPAASPAACTGGAHAFRGGFRLATLTEAESQGTVLRAVSAARAPTLRDPGCYTMGPRL